MPLAPGTPIPPLTLLDQSGRSFVIRDDRPVLLFFFKTTCPVCRLAAPAVQTLFEQFHSAAQIVPVSQDAPAEAMPWLLELGLMAEPAFDHKGFRASADFELFAVPTTFLIEGGRVATVVEGWNRDGWNGLAQQLAERTGAPFVPVSQPGDGRPAFRPG